MTNSFVHQLSHSAFLFTLAGSILRATGSTRCTTGTEGDIARAHMRNNLEENLTVAGAASRLATKCVYVPLIVKQPKRMRPESNTSLPAWPETAMTQWIAYPFLASLREDRRFPARRPGPSLVLPCRLGPVGGIYAPVLAHPRPYWVPP